MEDARRVLQDMNTEDFNTMRSMISEIEMKLLQVDPLKQKAFYMTMQGVIFNTWEIACNPNDPFLYGTQTNENQ
jgi:hypothetical protein